MPPEDGISGKEQISMSEKQEIWVCPVCGYEYKGEDGPFENLPEDWKCPICGLPKSKFKKKP
jgi:rubredoxin